jgi:hypothetical protein
MIGDDLSLIQVLNTRISLFEVVPEKNFLKRLWMRFNHQRAIKLVAYSRCRVQSRTSIASRVMLKRELLDIARLKKLSAPVLADHRSTILGAQLLSNEECIAIRPE